MLIVAKNLGQMHDQRRPWPYTVQYLIELRTVPLLSSFDTRPAATIEPGDLAIHSVPHYYVVTPLLDQLWHNPRPVAVDLLGRSTP